MNRTDIATALVFAFIAGCIAARMTPEVPRARAGTVPTNWEYYCIESEPEMPAMTEMANRFGNQGWELADTEIYLSSSAQYASLSAALCFKRAVSTLPPSMADGR